MNLRHGDIFRSRFARTRLIDACLYDMLHYMTDDFASQQAKGR